MTNFLQVESKAKHFFFEKKKQKTFINLGHGRWRNRAHGPE
jgi:hypothetical protein